MHCRDFVWSPKVWDSSFFDRLWCNCEVAIFAKTSVADSLHFVPTWVPVWTLMSFALSCAEVALMSVSPSPLVFSTASRMDLFVSSMAHNAVPSYAFLVSAFPLLWFCFHKLHHHRRMLDQMSHFDIRDAKCTLETDRVVLEMLGPFVPRSTYGIVKNPLG